MSKNANIVRDRHQDDEDKECAPKHERNIFTHDNIDIICVWGRQVGGGREGGSYLESGFCLC